MPADDDGEPPDQRVPKVVEYPAIAFLVVVGVPALTAVIRAIEDPSTGTAAWAVGLLLVYLAAHLLVLKVVVKHVLARREALNR